MKELQIARIVFVAQSLTGNRVNGGFLTFFPKASS